MAMRRMSRSPEESAIVSSRAHAAVHLRAFLRKNAAVDSAKQLTLREELRRARRALAEIESD